MVDMDDDLDPNELLLRLTGHEVPCLPSILRV